MRAYRQKERVAWVCHARARERESEVDGIAHTHTHTHRFWHDMADFLVSCFETRAACLAIMVTDGSRGILLTSAS
jgi:hypothetical protein